MTRLQHRFAERHWIPSATAAAVLTYAALASMTHPFTEGAEVVTAIPLATAVVIMVIRTRTDRRSDLIALSGGVTDRDTRLNHWLLAWVMMIVAIAGWELYCYASEPRSEHPTLSTLIDLLDSTRTGKALAFASWLALGCYLVLQ